MEKPALVVVPRAVIAQEKKLVIVGRKIQKNNGLQKLSVKTESFFVKMENVTDFKRESAMMGITLKVYNIIWFLRMFSKGHIQEIVLSGIYKEK